MDNIADVTFTGDAAGDYFGVSVSSAGDVNKDEYDDVIIGASQNDAGGNSSGRAYLYFGGQNMNNNADLIFSGAAKYDYFGASVANAGDFNDDNYDDVVIGAPGAIHAYVFFGDNNMNNISDVNFTGEAAGDSYGCSVSGAGDVNKDGVDDLVVGAEYNAVAGKNAGRAYLYLGGYNMDNSSDVVFTGTSTGTVGDCLGHSVSNAGDINNDSYDDVIISAVGRQSVLDGPGYAYVFLEI